MCVPANKEVQETIKGKTDRWKDGYVVSDRPGNIPRTLGRLN